MDFCIVPKWIILVLGMVIWPGFDAFAGSVHTYGGQFDLRIPADPEASKGWMHDAVVDVPDHLAIRDVDVRISLTHTHVFDLKIFLESPAGTRICLVTYNPFSEYFEGENYTQTVFDDEAEIVIDQGQPPFTGRFRPREPYRLAAFDGEDCFGPWRLQIYDAWDIDTGRLNSFDLLITAIEPPKVIALPAAEVGRTSATLSGFVVDDGGQPCGYRFSYWTDGYYCCTGWSDPCDAKTTGQSFGLREIGLGAGLYYFTAQARNSAGEGDWATPECFSIVRPFSGSGSGTEADPYIITNVQELQQVNNDLSAWYELGNDIDGSDTRTWLSGYGFTPIGCYSTAFRGAFDGKGHVISGLYMNWDLTFCVGLFGCAEESEIKNVGLVDAAITGWTCTGGLVAINKGIIKGCYVSGDVNGVAKVGGLVGLNSGLIQNCYSTAGVSGGPEGISIAGLVGQNSGGILEKKGYPFDSTIPKR
jgi:subtilisin-like proprotein convertase family protein